MSEMFQKMTVGVLSVLVSGIFGFSAFADDFFQGRSIRLVVGFSPGGGYDTYTRAIARHMGKHIPGNPTFVVQNMTGAGSLIAANYTQNRAKPNGLTLGVWNSSFVLYQALGDRKVKIESRELNWIGAPVKGLPACGIMASTGLRTLDEIFNSNKRLKMGGTRAGSTGVDLPKILNRTIGTNFEVISGYAGTAKVRLAMQSGELDGACWGWESMRTTARSMLDAKGKDEFIPFIIHKNVPDPEVENIPETPEVIAKLGGKAKLAVYKAWSGQYEFQRPMVAPPGVPAERVEILRSAYKATLEDPEFLKDAKRSLLLIEYVSPKEIYDVVDQILTTPASAKESLDFLVRKPTS